MKIVACNPAPVWFECNKYTMKLKVIAGSVMQKAPHEISVGLLFCGKLRERESWGGQRCNMVGLLKKGSTLL